MHEEEVVLANGLKLRGLRWGQTDGARKVIALHGWLDNAATFVNMASALDRDCDFLALDLAGHGRSEHRPRGTRYHLVDNVEDVIQFADALGWGQFVLMGHSMGGGIASLLAAAFPERVEKLILLESVGPKTVSPFAAPDRLREAIETTHKARPGRMPKYKSEEGAAHARSNSGQVISIEAARTLCTRALAVSDSRFTWSSDPRLKTVSALSITEPMIEAYLQRIQCDVLVVGAEEGYGACGDVFESRLAQISKLERVLLPGNHHFHLEPSTAKAVSTAVARFIRSEGSTA